MSCYGCAAKFTIFKKEYGCALCGFGFCSKCLKKSDTQQTKKDQLVCKKCLTNKSVKSNVFMAEKYNVVPNAPASSTVNYQREGNLKTAVSSVPANPDEQIAARLAKLREDLPKKPLSCEDEIRQRLAKLREDNKLPPCTDDEIRERLEKLKGINYRKPQPSTKMPAFEADLRSDQQKIDDLLKQYQAEYTIDSTTENRNSFNSSDDSDTEVKKLTTQIMDELKLENVELNNATLTNVPTKKKNPKMLKRTDRGTPLHASTPELSFCVICYSCATMRCLDCDGDLYCKNCFTEIHRDWDETYHKSVPYEKPQTSPTTSEEDDSLENDEY